MYEDLFSKRGLSLDRLKALVDVEAAGSISRAVGGDTVRQSLYSRQLKELEAFFEVELTKRQGRGLRLTEAGTALARLAREQFIGLSDFQEVWADKPQTYSIGAGDSLLHWLFMPAAPQIAKDHPEIRFSLHNHRSVEIVEMLSDLTLDFGIIREKALRKPLKSANLGVVSYSLFVPEALLGRKRGAKAEWILENLPLATQANDSTFHDTLEAAARDAGVSLKIQLYCESFPEAAEALRNASHAAILPTIAGKAFAAGPFIEYDFSLLKKVSRPVVLAWNQRLMNIRASADRVRETIEMACRIF